MDRIDSINCCPEAPRIDLPEHKAPRLRDLGAGQIVDTPAAAGASPQSSPRPRTRL
jgi:hypothetical protein